MRNNLIKEKFQNWLNRIKEPLTITKYESRLKYLSTEDKNEIEQYIELSFELFNLLKKEGVHKLEFRYPNLTKCELKELDDYFDRDERKIKNVVEIGIIDNELCKKDDKNISIRFKLFAYLIYSESVLFLFEEIINKIRLNGKKSKLDYFTIERLCEAIINDASYKQFKELFSALSKNLRNAIGHSDYYISESQIKYFYYNSEHKDMESSEISIQEFQIKLLKLSLLFDVLIYQIDKPFLGELESIYQKYFT